MMPRGPNGPKGFRQTAISTAIIFVLGISAPLWLPLMFIGFGPLHFWYQYRGRDHNSNYKDKDVRTYNLAELDRIANRRREMNAPPKLPAIRPRALTLPLSHIDIKMEEKPKRRISSVRVTQTTNDQVESSVLYTLPLEIRTMIWRYALTGHHIHVARRRRRLGHVICPHPSIAAKGGRDLCTERRDGSGYWLPTNYPPRVSPLSLIKTCRQIYSETIDLLYLENTFAFTDPEAFLWFHATVLHSHIQLVRSIEIAFEYRSSMGPNYWPWDLHPPFHHHPWNETCNAIASMPRLADLKIIASTDSSMNMPLTQVKEQFDLLSSRLLKPHSVLQVLVPSGYDVRVAAEMEALFRLENALFTILRAPLHTDDIKNFVLPFHIRCLHCSNGTVISQGVCTAAERCRITNEESLPRDESFLPEREFYRVRHGNCGGLLEFETKPSSRTWQITHGAERLESG